MELILKCDDFWGKDNEATNLFLHEAIKNRTKLSLGVVGSGLTKAPERIINLVKNNLDLFELFNHSYYHLLDTNKKEFFKTERAYQEASIEQTNGIISYIFGNRPKTIGFPANACDQTTLDILKESDLENIYYVKGSYNYEDILKIGKKIINVGKEFGVLQVHPFSMTEQEIKSFFETLKKENNKLIFPSEYGQRNSNEKS